MIVKPLCSAYRGDSHLAETFRRGSSQSARRLVTVYNLADALDHFLTVHRPQGRLTPTVGDETPNGYRLAIACPCGVTFERWVTPEDAIEDLLRARLRAERN